MKTKTTYEWALEVVDEHDDIIDVWHHDDLKHYTDKQIGLVLNRNSFTVEFGATGTVLCRYELALTKRRYEVLPTYNAKGEAGDDLLDLLDIGYAYVGCDNERELPDEFDEAPGKVPARFKAALAKRLTNIQA